MLSLGRQDFSPVLCAMPARLVVLPNRPRPSHPRWLLSRRHRACVSPLAATLMNLPASVANKRLTAQLNLLDATLTKNAGGILFRFRNSPPPTHLSPLHQALSFQTLAHSFATMRGSTLFLSIAYALFTKNHPG